MLAIGITWFDGRSIYPILKQSHIEIFRFATPAEIAEHMLSLGFNQVTDSQFADENYIVSDLFPRNVLKDKQGNIYVIDDIITENLGWKLSKVFWKGIGNHDSYLNKLLTIRKSLHKISGKTFPFE